MPLARAICPSALAMNAASPPASARRSEEHTSELQSQSNLVCRLLLEKKKQWRLPLVAMGTTAIILIGTLTSPQSVDTTHRNRAVSLFGLLLFIGAIHLTYHARSMILRLTSTPRIMHRTVTRCDMVKSDFFFVCSRRVSAVMAGGAAVLTFIG